MNLIPVSSLTALVLTLVFFTPQLHGEGPVDVTDPAHPVDLANQTQTPKDQSKTFQEGISSHLKDDKTLDQTTKDHLATVLCGNRKPCNVISSASAGKDSQGRDLIVAELDVCPADECSLTEGEIWVAAKNGQLIERQQLLVKMSSFGSDAPGSNVGPNRFKFAYEIDGMSYGHHRNVAIQLSPLAILEDDSGQKMGGSGTGGSQNLCWDSLDGTTEESEMESSVGSASRAEYHPIPEVEPPTGWVQGGWKQTPIGSCALTLGSKKSPGYVLAGKDLPSLISELKIVMTSPQDIFVQVATNAFVSGSVNWLYDDHLELWTANGPKAKQWGIRFSDGSVFPAYGHPKDSPTVQMADVHASQGLVRTLFIHLSSALRPERLAISYSKGNRSKVVELLSTSRITFGHSASLGRLRLIEPRIGNCQVKDGRLSFNHAVQWDKNSPIIACDQMDCKVAFPNL
jgi:hypothetical protein